MDNLITKMNAGIKFVAIYINKHWGTLSANKYKVLGFYTGMALSAETKQIPSGGEYDGGYVISMETTETSSDPKTALSIFKTSAALTDLIYDLLQSAGGTTTTA